MKVAFSKAEIESQIAARFGSKFSHYEKTPAEVMSTGMSTMDVVIGGGFPRGAITEIFGPASSGRTSFLLSTLAHATNCGEVCALVDTSDLFDPVSAVRADVALDQLLW